MAAYGLIGYSLTHSFSPAYFTKKFREEHIDATYTGFPLHNIKEFPALLQKHPGLQGLNVTIPYKETVIPYLDELDDVAAEIQAVNCIILKNGIKKGYNTDAIGFEQSLVPLLQSYHKHALILGTGGASMAVAYVLKKLGISFQKVSSTKENLLNYNELTTNILQQHTLIINTTPLGMFPHTDTFPSILYEALTQRHLLYDLIYNPAETKFLTLGRQQGATIKNGFEMLQLQAEASWRIWNSH